VKLDFQFDFRSGALDVEAMRELVQFLCIMRSMQHTPSKAPVIWETQRWWIGAGWKPTTASGFSMATMCYTDQHGEEVLAPQASYGWVVHSHKLYTDSEGWKYGNTLPDYEAMSEHIADTVFSAEGGIGKVVRWRAWKNGLARQVMKYCDAHSKEGPRTVGFAQLEAAVEAEFGVVHEAFQHAVGEIMPSSSSA
jgi:hypothetical protein